MKDLDVSVVDALQHKTETMDLLLLKLKRDGYKISRGDLIIFQSSLNMLISEVVLMQQRILQTQFRDEDKHYG